MAMVNASRTFISFCMNLSGMVSGHVGGAVHRIYICLCFSFLSKVLTRRGLITTVSWKMRGLSAKRARSICGVHLLAGAVKRSWSEDGACDVQTSAARCGEHGESRMVRPLCTIRRGTDARTGFKDTRSKL
jgi:hypothetical protein